MANAADGTDEDLPVPVIPERLANSLQRGRDGGVRNETPGPDRRDHFFFADDPLVVLDQEAQQPEDLGFKLDQPRRRSKLGTIRVQFKWVELKLHART